MTLYKFPKKSKRGRPSKSLKDLYELNFKRRTNDTYKTILDFLEEPKNKDMDLETFMSRLARRATLDPESRHYNCNHCQVFTRIINGEDVFKAPVFEPIDGVALMSFLVIGEGRMK